MNTATEGTQIRMNQLYIFFSTSYRLPTRLVAMTCSMQFLPCRMSLYSRYMMMKTTYKEWMSLRLLWWWYMLLIPLLFGVIEADLAEPCRNVIEVNRGAGLDCSSTSVHDLLNQTCNDLQDVLMSVSLDQTSPSFEECVEVIMHPDKYIITEPITIQQNVVLRGTQNVMVTFKTLYPTNTLDPYYVLTFADSDYIGISGIDFHTSPGIITFQNVTNVVVEDCSFR